MTEEPGVTATFVTAVSSLTTADGKFVVIAFTAGDGSQTGYVLNPAILSDLLAALLDEARVASSRRAEPIVQGREETLRPIETTAISIGPGRAEWEAILALKSGPLTLAFAISLEMLTAETRKLLASVRDAPPKKPN